MESGSRHGPIQKTRDELYAEVWATPMNKLGAKYGISGNGLAKICDRLNVPYPPRGYWAKKAAGKSMAQTPLPPAAEGTIVQVTISPTPAKAPAIELPRDVQKEVRAAAKVGVGLVVPERLTRPHPIIATWIEERERRRREARRSRNDFDVDPGEFTESDRRRHRVLHTLLKALEGQGAVVNQTDRGELKATRDGEDIIFTLRERQKQIRRPLNERELRWRSPGDKDWRQELQPTGLFVLDFKTYMPDGLRRPWAETEKQPIESMLGDILATFVAAWPLLAERTRQRLVEAERRHQEEIRRYEEERHRKRDDNRWRYFVQLGYQKRDAEIAEQLLRSLVVAPVESDTQIGDRTLAEWVAWAAAHIHDTNPANIEPARLFKHLADITEYSQVGPR